MWPFLYKANISVDFQDALPQRIKNPNYLSSLNLSRYRATRASDSHLKTLFLSQAYFRGSLAAQWVPGDTTMRSLKALSTLSVIASFHHLVQGAPLQMVLWDGDSDVYKEKPTWHAESSGFFFQDKVTSLGFFGLRDIAKSHYEWVSIQSGATTFNGHCMVAAFWDPTNSVVYASTIPLGPRRAEMKEAASDFGAAPAWYNQARTVIGGSNPKIHAEDGAFYNYESAQIVQNGQPYPPGSMIAIYGKYASWNQAGPIDPCGGGTGDFARQPSCQTVSTNLNVRFAPNANDRALQQAAQAPPPPPPGQGAPATANPAPQPPDAEFDMDLDDDDWEATFAKLQADIGQGAQQQKRHWHRRDKLQERDASSSVPAASGWEASCDALKGTYKPTPASISSISVSLPAIDFGLGATGTVSIISASSGGATSTIITGPSSTSSAPPPPITTNQQNDDPDSGIEQQGCICTSGAVTETLPLLATNVDYSSSCAYTALTPSQTIAITTNWGAPYTNTHICSACSPTTVFGVGTCTSIPNCRPQTPSATKQIGSSPVPVGTLTSDALVSSISSAISVLCPPQQTGCDQETKVPIKGIVYVEDDSKLDDGELLVQIDSASFQQSGNDNTVRSALFGMAAHSFAAAASGSNCANHTYAVEEFRRRDSVDDDDANSTLVPRDHPYLAEESILLCNAAHFTSPQYYAQDWREQEQPGPQDYVSVEINFKTGPGGALICDFIEEFMEFVEATFTPELLPEEQVADNEISKTLSPFLFVIVGRMDADLSVFFSLDIACEAAVSLAGG